MRTLLLVYFNLLRGFAVSERKSGFTKGLYSRIP